MRLGSINSAQPRHITGSIFTTSGRHTKGRRNLSATFILLLFLLSPHSELASQTPWSLSRLTAALAQDVGSTVRFSEERQLQYLTEPLFLEGTLTFKPPGYLERQVVQPKWQRMIIDGDLVTIEENWKDPPIRVLLSDYPALEAFVSALRSILAGDQRSLERTYATALEGTEDAWLLSLTPRPQQLRDAVSEVRITGAGGNIQSIEVMEAGGDRSIITIHGKI